ncbi:hypothetical protein BDV19DRAFT_153868 [Aspergillus venezuelensis]
MSVILLNADPTFFRSSCLIAFNPGQSIRTWATVSVAPHWHLSSSLNLCRVYYSPTRNVLLCFGRPTLFSNPSSEALIHQKRSYNNGQEYTPPSFMPSQFPKANMRFDLATNRRNGTPP